MVSSGAENVLYLVELNFRGGQLKLNSESLNEHIPC